MAEGNPTGLAANNSFDPYSQMFVLTMPDGVTQSAIPLASIDVLLSTATQTAIIYGIQTGICIILFLVLLLITRPDKRRSVIFAMNIATLLFILIRAILIFLQLGGPLYDYYNWINGYYPNVGESNRLSITAEVFSFLTIAAIELSMLFQTQIVCCTLRARYRHTVTVTCALVAFQAITIRFACMVLNADWGIADVAVNDTSRRQIVAHLSSAFNISVVCSIIFFSSIFCAKLGYAIYQRRRLGMKQFGPMQIIFVMGCQTLLVPIIFGIISYWILPTSQLYSMMPVVVAVFLPFSSLWASTNTGNSNIAAPLQWHHRNGTNRSDAKDGNIGKGLLDATAVTAKTFAGPDHSTASPRKLGHYASASHDSIDLEMAKLGQRIHVDRTYSVRSD